ncbi:rRNA maturation RNase YbeY [Rhodonellum sp.]|uniref:rRNA maturation RNase YbeY n=1 Tax=Rhodonellum sp. TaxID=2231180 RepID=UPI002715791B|nr:rRNA maturation RNase YbeY [Rhodonellum sp.]MDO9552634.1 rRNA maturation RNase YbeY [Rhodonellum sp.]
MAIQFFEEEIKFQLKEKNKHKKWLKKIAEEGGYSIGEINYVFCSDEYLHQKNLEYLNHDTLTDIITFDNSEGDNKIEADIFISIDRVIDNSQRMDILFETELLRVMSHGILHLMGYKDKKEEEVLKMRKMEEVCIHHFQNM